MSGLGYFILKSGDLIQSGIGSENLASNRFFLQKKRLLVQVSDLSRHNANLQICVFKKFQKTHFEFSQKTSQHVTHPSKHDSLPLK